MLENAKTDFIGVSSDERKSKACNHKSLQLEDNFGRHCSPYVKCQNKGVSDKGAAFRRSFSVSSLVNSTPLNQHARIHISCFIVNSLQNPGYQLSYVNHANAIHESPFIP